MMSSSAAKKEGLGADSEDSNSVSSKPEDDHNKQPRMRRSEETSSTTNEPSSASATATEVSTAVARHPTSRSGLPTLADAAAEAAPRVPLKEKKPRRAGFREEQFLKKLRVMLDRESQNDSTAVQWSADGNSFIITDQNQFEEHIIPTYFDKQIVFASFLNKLYRWGFKRVSSNRAGRYEFGSPTFKRLDADSEPAAAAAATAVNSTGDDEGGASIQVQQQPPQAFSSSLQQDVTAQTNQLLASNPLLTSQADANNGITDMISNLISNVQRQLSSQQPVMPSQQFVLNQNTNPLNNTDANSILQGIMSSNQQQLLSPHSTPSHQPMLNQSTNHPLNMNHNILQSFQQRQHPNSNTTSNLLNTALSILAGGQAPSSTQLMGHHSPSSQNNNAVHALMSLNGMTLPQPTFPNTITSAAMSQPNNMAVQTLLTLMHRISENERERRAQADAVNHAIISTIGQYVGGNNMIDEAERQRRLVAALGQSHGSTGVANTPNVALGSGMTVGVPYIGAAQSQQVDAPPPPASNQNIQADSIAAILQAARRDDAAGQLEKARAQNNNPDHGDDEDGNDGGGKADGPLSERKRKSPGDDQYDGDDDNSWADDDSWNKRLRPRKKSPRK